MSPYCISGISSTSVRIFIPQSGAEGKVRRTSHTSGRYTSLHQDWRQNLPILWMILIVTSNHWWRLLWFQLSTSCTFIYGRQLHVIMSPMFHGKASFTEESWYPTKDNSMKAFSSFPLIKWFSPDTPVSSIN